MADWNRRFPLVDGGWRSARADRDGGVLMKAFIQLTNNRSCLLRADEIKADYVYMTEPRKETDNGC